MWEYEFARQKEEDPALQAFLKQQEMVDRLHPRVSFFGRETVSRGTRQCRETVSQGRSQCRETISRGRRQICGFYFCVSIGTFILYAFF